MKKIINRKLYNTDTATKIAHYELNVSKDDPTWYEEDLYRKRSGEYFIHGSGNELTRYAQTKPEIGSRAGESIVFLTYAQAEEWSKRHMPPKEYSAEFGKIKKSDKRMHITLSISEDAADTARRNAAQCGIRLSAYIERLIMEK